MRTRIKPSVVIVSMAFSTLAWAQVAPATLDTVIVSNSRQHDLAEAASLNGARVLPWRAATSDTASLLQDVPGMAVSGAGGVSGLPVLHGLADDRIRIKVDGMDLISACSNHMNPPLSYIAPTRVESVAVYAGIAPVSVGGDSIAGSVIIKSRAPQFAETANELLSTGQASAFYRSNGDAHGTNLSATLASERFSIRYDGATAQSNNYRAAEAFKAPVLATWTRTGSHWIAGDEVGSSAYKSENQALSMAMRHENHLLELRLAYQRIPYQGFPNQHMDMTDNKSNQFNLSYAGQFGWGRLEARAYQEVTRHKMDFADDKLYWYGVLHNVAGMPMETEGRNAGVSVKADVVLNERDLLRLGGEAQRYRLNDWWAPVANSGMMSPRTFINVNDGQRDRQDVFAELESRWNNLWLTQLGARYSRVDMNAGRVDGYNNMYAADYNAFNARDRSKTDHNLDLSALARYTPSDDLSLEGGYARKVRSPSVYERYTWSGNGMAMTMNNWLNDGNGYVGDVDLKPEVAHTVSLTADWKDTAGKRWGMRLTPYFSYVNDYIDAKCRTAPCASNAFVYLRLVNQDARLAGLDWSGFRQIGRSEALGTFTARGQLAYVQGKNRTTGDHLYNIMPLNARLALEQQLGAWSNVIESQLVAAKNDVSSVRNEMRTAGYALLNLRSSYDTPRYRIDIGIENALDKQYSHPLSGAYIGQGSTMSLNGTGAPYGVTVPGMGRSLYVGATLKF